MDALTSYTNLLASRQNPGQTASTPDMAAARRAGRDFEAMFLGQMFSHMFTDVGANGLFGGGHAEEVYQSMLHQELGGVIGKRGGLGIADAITRQILKAQEAQRT
jgi:peptidoglycan hydrolase FlgJ